MIDQVSQSHDVDPNRVYAMGHSNGAMLSYRLACQLSDQIVAVGMVSGTRTLDSCTPSQPVSLIQVHGTADQNVPIDGGRGSSSISQVDYNPPVQASTSIAAADSCPDPSVDQSGDFTTTSWQPCAASTAVRMVVIAGSPHAWPGSVDDTPNIGSKPYPNYDATYEVVAFLLSHPRTTG